MERKTTGLGLAMAADSRHSYCFFPSRLLGFFGSFPCGALALLQWNLESSPQQLLELSFESRLRPFQKRTRQIPVLSHCTASRKDCFLTRSNYGLSLFQPPRLSAIASLKQNSRRRTDHLTSGKDYGSVRVGSHSNSCSTVTRYRYATLHTSFI